LKSRKFVTPRNEEVEMVVASLIVLVVVVGTLCGLGTGRT
jgi:hypothetical protein